MRRLLTASLLLSLMVALPAQAQEAYTLEAQVAKQEGGAKDVIQALGWATAEEAGKMTPESAMQAIVKRTKDNLPPSCLATCASSV